MKIAILKEMQIQIEEKKLEEIIIQPNRRAAKNPLQKEKEESDSTEKLEEKQIQKEGKKLEERQNPTQQKRYRESITKGERNT